MQEKDPYLEIYFLTDDNIQIKNIKEIEEHNTIYEKEFVKSYKCNFRLYQSLDVDLF